MILVIANGTGTTFVLDGWISAAEKVKNGGQLSGLEIRTLGRYLYKLPLEPEWTTQLAQLDELWSQTNPPGQSDLAHPGTQQETTDKGHRGS